MNDDLLERMSRRVAGGELLSFTPKEREALVEMKKALGLTSEQAEQAVKLQEESDRARGLLPTAEVPAQEQESEQEPEQEGETEPEPVPASAGKGKAKK